MPPRVDVLVVGGGPAGLATAIALLRKGCSVVVIERSDYRGPRVGEHLPPGAKDVLASLDLLAVVESSQHAACPGICSVWGGDEPVERPYLFHPNGEGLNLSRPAFDTTLAAHVERLGGVVVTQATVGRLSRVSRLWHADIHSPGSGIDVECNVMVDASGRKAAVARRLGASVTVYDELIGLIGYGKAAGQRDRLVLIEACRDGWWYSTGLAGDIAVVAFMTDASLVDTTVSQRSAAWRARLCEAPMTAARLDGAEQETEILVRSARTQCLDRIVGDGWVATGDAAMSFDPLSSAGTSKALEWGQHAALAAHDLFRGSPSSALAYENEMQRAFGEYLVTRYRYYAAERRWSDAPFWRRRLRPPRPVGATASAAPA